MDEDDNDDVDVDNSMFLNNRSEQNRSFWLDFD